MISIILGILGVIAAGCLVAYAVILTFKWLVNKVKEKLSQKNVKKVAVADLEELINNCDNKMSFSDLESLTKEGYTHVVATVDNDGNVSEVEAIKDTSETIDQEVEELINRTGDGMIVIEGE